MTVPNRHELELNELGWWANWAALKWVGRNAYVLTSPEMPEEFFNRGGMMDCGQVASSLGRLEVALRSIGGAQLITIPESCNAGRLRLARAGYRVIDLMSVMIAIGGSRPREGLSLRTSPSSSAKDWTRAYLLAFYGDTILAQTVEGVVKRLLERDSATLLEGRLGGEVVGVLAVYRTSQLAGVYCVGTVPRFRRRGVAQTLLSKAWQIASSERRALFLQTLNSYSLEPFYARIGFKTLYRKVLMRMP